MVTYRLTANPTLTRLFQLATKKVFFGLVKFWSGFHSLPIHWQVD
ncbi:hypothetical protein Nizo2259_1144 [Lactiplantibacillus plantarum]|uniref:Uncharacterized protein n=4 Tax=Lactiplantibacillus TaxID=2767842 RepID=A0A165MF64_LACPN|nr:hypothetical protein LPST_C0768 [Lactiplantibacillus plantarum ST-III]AGE38545.1 Hypothetical protein zj316_1006 [Lactiplantibacillus plantarum ZJ316]AGL63501.2 hypothetical protein LBP_cg0755 [Lactiplantibacillus plantarum subsp. plantarum P-8]ALC07979.1 hypothetical protein JM48_0769 [Lactiplantibacillus plantarum]ERL45576.1 hypothetical protein N644_0398 [Lactiplantibacillus paraplantarum]ERO42874.1 hypothetical protein LPLWJ_02190 [Lactiplantibacillus plantarum WJL]ETF10785.1 hypotheti